MGILAILSIEIPICAVSIIIKKKDGGFQFKSETELENFVYIHLDKLLNLSPIARQYRIGTEICDILATNDRNDIGIVELKNVEDRYIVQQLTRYCDGLIQSKPKIDGIDYHKPTKLIAIAPSFHAHNFIDRKYSKLNIDFFTFAIVADRMTEDIFLELTDVETKKKYVVQIPDIKRNKVAKSQESTQSEIDYNEMIDYYMRLNYSSKLGIEQLSPEELRKLSEKYKSKCTKEFKLSLEFIDKYKQNPKQITKVQRTVTIKLPIKVRISDLYRWCEITNIGSKDTVNIKHKFVNKTRAGVFKIKIYSFNPFNS
jgi:hypothetical protein